MRRYGGTAAGHLEDPAHTHRHRLLGVAECGLLVDDCRPIRPGGEPRAASTVHESTLARHRVEEDPSCPERRREGRGMAGIALRIASTDGSELDLGPGDTNRPDGPT